MAIVTLGGPWFAPSNFGKASAGAPLLVNLGGITAGTHKFATVIQAPKTGTLHSFEMIVSTVAVAPTNGLRFSFQDLDATANPDGTADQYRVVTAGIATNGWLAPPGPITHDGTDSGTKRSVTAGAFLACVVEFASPYVAGSLDWKSFQSGTRYVDGAPYHALYGGASWAKVSAWIPAIALRYDDGYVPVPMCWPVKAITTHTVNTGTTPDEIGNTYTFPVTVEVGAVWLDADLDGDFHLVVYDSDGTTELASVACDADAQQATGSGIGYYVLPRTTFTAAATYRIAVRPSTATSLTLYSVDVESQARLDGIVNQDCYYTAQTNDGGFANTTTRFLLMGVGLTGVDSGGGGGGGSLAGPIGQGVIAR